MFYSILAAPHLKGFFSNIHFDRYLKKTPLLKTTS